MYDQYGRERANAILGTVMTKIFLPGLDDVTAEYASKQLGDTTIFSKTFQDYPGKKNDNTRYAEQRRTLMHASEIRQIARHSEVLIVSDTAPPIRAAYPPLAVMRDCYAATSKGSPREIHLGDVDPLFLLTQATDPTKELKENKQEFMSVVSAAVDRVFTDRKIIELFAPETETAAPDQAPITEEVEELDETTSRFDHADALDDLTSDLRLKLADKYERILTHF